MTYTEIIHKISDEMNISEFAHSDYPSSICTSTGRGTVFLDEIGECRDMDSHGGEGQGEDWWCVKYFPDHDVYIKVRGYYTSYDGTQFDGWENCFEVRPREKVVIVYDPI